MLQWFNEGGIIMWILLTLSIVSWCFIFERLYVIVTESRAAVCIKKQLKESAYRQGEVLRIIGENASAMAEVLRVACDNEREKKEENVVLTRTQLREETSKLQRGLTFLEIAASVSPLLGLLGTVLGMVEVFSVIAKIGVGDPTALSSGISKALNTTVFGLIVAIPSLAAFSFYERKIENLVRSVDQCATLTLTEMYKDKK